MTKFLLTRTGGPWDYPTLGFRADNGAILDGSLSTPAMTVPPDAYWSVYGGGSAESGITRTGVPTTTPTPETTDGYVLAYSDDANTFVPVDPATLVTGGGASDSTIAGYVADPDSDTALALSASYAHLDDDGVLVIDGEPVGGSDSDVTPALLAARDAAIAAQGAAEQAALDAADISGITVTDDVLEALVRGIALVGPKSRLALMELDTAAPKNPLTNIYKARDGVFIAALYGMSITSAGTSPAQIFGPLARRVYGAPQYAFLRGGFMGGTLNAWQGWDKQPYGGLVTLRARGNTATTPLLNYWYGDTYDFVFSREADSVATDVKVDGVVVGQTPGPGAQAYNQHVTGKVALGPHVSTVDMPAGAGYVYLEYAFWYDSTTPGVIELDFTMGGSNMLNMHTLATKGNVDGIPIEGDNGVIAHYGRTDFDLIFNGHDVNDTNAPTIDEALGIIRQISTVSRFAGEGVPVMHISTMAGNFAISDYSGKAQYDRIKNEFRSQATVWSHVSHFDWDSLTRMPQAFIDDGTYQDVYYKDVDFIHPEAPESYRIGQVNMARHLGLPSPHADGLENILDVYRHPQVTPYVKRGSGPTRVLTYRGDLVADGPGPGIATNFRFPTLHGLRVNDKLIIEIESGFSGNTSLTGRNGVEHFVYVKTLVDPYTVILSDTLGGDDVDGYGSSGAVLISRIVTTPPLVRQPAAGFAAVDYNGVQTLAPMGVTEFYIDRTIHNTAWNSQNQIDASTNADRFGKWLPNPYINGALLPDEPSTLSIKLVAPDYISFTPRAGMKFSDALGQPSKSDVQGLTFVTNDEPVVIVIHCAARTGLENTLNVQDMGNTRVYEVCWVTGHIPIMHGR